jgi:hypothetical protein
MKHVKDNKAKEGPVLLLSQLRELRQDILKASQQSNLLCMACKIKFNLVDVDCGPLVWSVVLSQCADQIGRKILRASRRIILNGAAISRHSVFLALCLKLYRAENTNGLDEGVRTGKGLCCGNES